MDYFTGPGLYSIQLIPLRCYQHRGGFFSYNVKDPTFLQGLNEYGFQLTGNIVFYTAGKRLCFRIHCTLIIFNCQ